MLHKKFSGNSAVQEVQSPPFEFLSVKEIAIESHKTALTFVSYGIKLRGVKLEWI